MRSHHFCLVRSRNLSNLISNGEGSRNLLIISSSRDLTVMLAYVGHAERRRRAALNYISGGSLTEPNEFSQIVDQIPSASESGFPCQSSSPTHQQSRHLCLLCCAQTNHTHCANTPCWSPGNEQRPAKSYGQSLEHM